MGAWKLHGATASLIADAAWPTQLIVAAVTAVFLWRSWTASQRRRQQATAAELLARQHGCAPPKPWNAKWPLGLDMLLQALQHSRENHILRFMVGVTDATGTTFAQYLLGARGILTIDPANVETVLSTRFEDFGLGLRAPTFYPLLGSGIFTQDGLAWKTSRKLLRPLFSHSSSSLPSLRERDANFMTIQRCVDNLAASIRRAD